ncbi:hypothetical protein FRC10_011153 [Ceratobasidium sp. 414]|nr:hypothetical protein FRC10_011153 [Ceratobasidium sp. 414]
MAAIESAMESQPGQHTPLTEPTVPAARGPAPPDPSQNAPLCRRWRRAGNEFANTSLTSSHALLQRASWSSRTDREGRLVIKFDFNWRSPLCAVEQWYQTQLERSRESGSTTRFASIQHRRNRDSPYFHEFLLIQLPGAEGSYYRIERTGIGSNVRAVTLPGCTACDMVEWFPKDNYERSILDTPSDLIAEVQFPSDFDILDILAVCYSIQQRRARNYSLQCFNCYWFCCTVLSILARRSVNIESMASSGRWGGLLDQVFGKISSLCCSPLTPEAKKYSVLRVCSALAPQNPSPGQIVVDMLRNLLWGRVAGDPTAGKGLEQQVPGVNQGNSLTPLVQHQIQLAAPNAFENALVDTLWLHDLNRLLRMNLRPIVQTNAGYLCFLLLRQDSVITGSKRTTSYKLAQKVYAREYADYALKNLARNHQRWDLLSHGNRKAAFSTRVVDGLLRLPLGFASGLYGGYSENRLHGFQGMSGEYASDFEYELQGNVDLLDREAENNFLNDVFDVCESSGSPVVHELPAKIVQILAQFGSDWSGLIHAIQALLHDNLEMLVKTEARSYGDLITLVRTVGTEVSSNLIPSSRTPVPHLQGETGRTSEKVDIITFQEYIREHVRTYATRVEQNHLGQSLLVCFDVETAISNVWRSLPKGHGAKVSARGGVNTN